jgi:hypothetical protein
VDTAEFDETLLPPAETSRVWSGRCKLRAAQRRCPAANLGVESGTTSEQQVWYVAKRLCCSVETGTTLADQRSQRCRGVVSFRCDLTD